MFWNPQDLLLMMGTEIFKIDAPWAEKLMKTRVSFLMNQTVIKMKSSRGIEHLQKSLNILFVFIIVKYAQDFESIRKKYSVLPLITSKMGILFNM